ncbi:hypothetical protein BGW37DRAFT_230305 [Umbelopsis sp. PMI_123]|nr:hypothetical protein BGW37DRAFT_230305 [Umbelopsis sp. PMI_123]
MPKYSSVDRPQYGTSPFDADRTVSSDTSIVNPILAAAVNTAKGKKRRDSAAPLISAPPIHNPILNNARQDPLSSLSRSNSFVDQLSRNGSPKVPYLEEVLQSNGDTATPTTHNRFRSGLHRRRRRGTTIGEEGSEEDSEGESSEEDDDSENDIDDSSQSGLSSDDDEEQIARQISAAKSTNMKPSTSHNYSNIDLSHLRDSTEYLEGYQRLLLPEEDMELTIESYRYNTSRLYLYRLSCVLSLGMTWLICRWMPHFWVKWVGIRSPMSKAEWFVIQNQWGSTVMVKPSNVYYNGTLSSVFSEDQLKQEIDGNNEHHGQTMLQHIDFQQNLPHLITLNYQYVRLAFNPILEMFHVVGYWKDKSWVTVKSLKQGLTRERHLDRLAVFGPNSIDIEEKPTLKLLVDEVLNPFYVFQIFSILLWCMDNYYYYAFCIFIISAVSIISTLLETKKTIKRMREMSRFECNVRVMRNNIWRSTSSHDLAVGDIIDITTLHTFPCDATLLTGDCIMNESMLTGESIPVSKIPITDTVLKTHSLASSSIPSELSKHFMFMGTKVVRVRATPSAGGVTSATALVLRTGFNTSKGSLVRSMLFPKPNQFQFYRDSFRFIGVLALIAVFGFLASSINFIRLGVDRTTMILRALDLVTIVVPPALPATMQIGTSFAISRLRDSGIFCISPPRVNIGGKVDCMCFDKTGTLTEDGLDIHGVQAVQNDNGSLRFTEEMKSSSEIESDEHNTNTTSSRIFHAMATCHSLKVVNEELVGDPLDHKMFEFIDWELEESGGATSIGAKSVSESAENGGSKISKGIVPTVVRPKGAKKFDISFEETEVNNGLVELGIIHSFEFISSLRRMSVIVRDLSKPHMEVFVKGAPEVMSEVCLPETIPQDYSERLYWYTHRGYRVIACASKSLTNVKWHKLHKLKRQEVEVGLTFVGFIIFENKLKLGTTPAIDTLRRANIRQIMCTGDNVLTAISVSRECSLVDQNAEIYIPRFVEGNSSDPNSIIKWESVLQEGYTLHNHTLLPQVSTQSASYEQAPFTNTNGLYYLAVTGEAFRWMVDYAPPEILNRLLVTGQIFARMSPDEKQELVEMLQQLDYCVGFCGDGANDCGALKAGDIGISLSEAEASVAAPFTSNTMDIGCVIDVIKEGRAALVTSFSCFKYMALYSIIQFTTVTLLYAFDSNLGDFQFLYIDLFLILPIAVYMGYTSAWPYLYKKRPTASLVSKKVLVSLLGQIIINSSFQFAMYWYIRTQSWYSPPDYDPDGENIECFENTVLFLLSCYQYILIAVVFSVGPPYRQPVWSNVRLIITLIVLTLLTVVTTLFPPPFLYAKLELENLPFQFRCTLLLVAITNFAICSCCEKYIFPWALTAFNSRAMSSITRDGYSPLRDEYNKKPSKKLFKRILADMEEERKRL